MLALAAAFVGLTALPAAADPPVEFSVSVPDVGVDPCTGEDFTVLLTFNIELHEHQNNTVLIIDSSSATSHGYEGNGHETAVTNQNHYISVFNWQAVNDETGGRFALKGKFKVDLETGEVQLEKFEFRCVGQPA